LEPNAHSLIMQWRLTSHKLSQLGTKSMTDS
jgi:hypothetical protein